MGQNLVHQMSVIKVDTDRFFKSQEEVDNFLYLLVKVLDMEVLIPPQSKCCSDEGNYGYTGLIGITTSSITYHAWDEYKYHMIDIYSCKPYSPVDIEKYLKLVFGANCKITMKNIDRMALLSKED
jgi:S-adenosylmethionine/arginine decarboxylase-like enzyme